MFYLEDIASHLHAVMIDRTGICEHYKCAKSGQLSEGQSYIVRINTGPGDPVGKAVEFINLCEKHAVPEQMVNSIINRFPIVTEPRIKDADFWVTFIANNGNGNTLPTSVEIIRGRIGENRSIAITHQQFGALGYAAFYPTGLGLSEIQSFTVHRELQKNGIGGKLLTSLLDLHDSQYPENQLFAIVKNHNSEGRQFFSQLGKNVCREKIIERVPKDYFNSRNLNDRTFYMIYNHNHG